MIHLLLFISSLLSPADFIDQVADPICPCHIPSDEIQELIDKMQTIAIEEHQAVGTLCISAPEVGIAKRIVLLYKEGTFQEFINPEIIWQEGMHILVRAYDRRCNVMTEEIGSDLASCFEKRFNHLNGM